MLRDVIERIKPNYDFTRFQNSVVRYGSLWASVIIDDTDLGLAELDLDTRLCIRTICHRGIRLTGLENTEYWVHIRIMLLSHHSDISTVELQWKVD